MYIREALNRRTPTKTIDPFAWSRAAELAARCNKRRSSTSEQAFLFPSPDGPNWLRSLRQSLPGMSSSSSPPLNWRQLRRALCRDCEAASWRSPRMSRWMAILRTLNSTAWKWTTRVRWVLNALRWRLWRLWAFPGSSRMSASRTAMHGFALALVVVRMIHPSSEREALRS